MRREEEDLRHGYQSSSGLFRCSADRAPNIQPVLLVHIFETLVLVSGVTHTNILL